MNVHQVKKKLIFQARLFNVYLRRKATDRGKIVKMPWIIVKKMWIIYSSYVVTINVYFQFFVWCSHLQFYYWNLKWFMFLKVLYNLTTRFQNALKTYFSRYILAGSEHLTPIRNKFSMQFPQHMYAITEKYIAWQIFNAWTLNYFISKQNSSIHVKCWDWWLTFC